MTISVSQNSRAVDGAAAYAIGIETRNTSAGAEPIATVSRHSMALGAWSSSPSRTAVTQTSVNRHDTATMSSAINTVGRGRSATSGSPTDDVVKAISTIAASNT